MERRVFVDGASGSTGLEMRGRLERRGDVRVIELEGSSRKDLGSRVTAARESDLTVMCLPDEASRELAGELGDEGVRLLDASSAHRTELGWTYGFEELCEGQGEEISGSRRVSNPGCFAVAAVAMLRPLRDSGALMGDAAVILHGVSGYTGGGKAFVGEYEKEGSARGIHEAYGLDLEHKHTRETAAWGGLSREPLFLPSVGRFPRGMLVWAPLRADTAGWSGVGAKETAALLQERYEGSDRIRVVEGEVGDRLSAEATAGRDDMELRVYGGKRGDVVIGALLDNLGFGAAGSAERNVELMLGLRRERREAA